MRYQYQIVASDGENETISIHFNHHHCGYLTMPKEEIKLFTKLIKARYKGQYAENKYQLSTPLKEK